MRATNKPFHIEKRWVYEAYQAIRSNGKAAGCGWADARAVRGRLIEKSLQDLESVVPRTSKGGAELEMEGGPLRSAYRGGSQTAGCC